MKKLIFNSRFPASAIRANSIALTKTLFVIPLLLFSLVGMAACSSDETPAPETDRPAASDDPAGSGEPDAPSVAGRALVVYFSAQGHTQAVAERIAELVGADIHRIEAAEPYAANPYDDSDRIQNEAYGDLRPAAANLPDAETIAQYETLFVGSPVWWHQPAMVVCTFLEAYDLKDKVVVPFFTYGAATYLNESMQKIFRLTPDSKHIPATLPEDLDADDITTPGRPDDAGIDMPGNADGTEAWLRRIGILK